MFTGSIVALVTPMNIDGEIDFDGLRRLVDWHLGSETDGILITGSTGEGATLLAEERFDILEAVITQVAGRIPVIAGTGTNNTEQSIALTRDALDLGAKAALAVVPYYNRPTQEGMRLHFEAIADVGLPIILYNVPSRTGSDILPETVFALSQVNNIIGIKEASSLERCITLVKRCPEPFAVYSGEDAQSMLAVMAGAKGVISTTANVMPRAMHSLMTYAATGDAMNAKILDEILQPMFKILFCETNPIPVKWALKEMELIEPYLRLPLTLLSEEKRGNISRVLKEIGVTGV